MKWARFRYLNEFAIDHAPILIGTCDRIDHLKNLVESLQNCFWAEKTDLYIAIDAPYAEEIRSVNQEIRRYCEGITGFASVIIINRPANLGPVENFNQAMDEMFETHTTLILLEDDNIVARNFLVYMNKALRTFADNSNCFAVCAYNYTSQFVEEPPVTDVFSAPYQSAWGVGYWRSKYKHPIQSVGERPVMSLLNPLTLFRMYRTNPPLFPAYVGAFLEGALHADQQHSINLIINNKYCIYPRHTKVINKGFDGSGMHCGNSDVSFHNDFEGQDKVEFTFVDIPSITDQHIRKNYYWFRVNIPSKWYKWLYAYVMYVGMLVAGRGKIIWLRNALKKYLI